MDTLDTIKFMLKFSLIAMLMLAAMFLFASITGRAVGDWREGSAQKINWSNPAPEEQALGAAIGISIIVFPFAALMIVKLLFALIRVTASEEAKRDADLALTMGEHGVGTRLLAGLPRNDDRGGLTDAELYLLDRIGRPRGVTYQERYYGMELELRRQGVNERIILKLMLSNACQQLLQ